MDLYRGTNTTQGGREYSKRSMVTLLGLSAYSSRKDDEREPLSRSRFERWSGAVDEACDPLAPDERNDASISGGSGSTLRSSKVPFLRAAKARFFKKQSETSYLLGSRERAATSVRSPEGMLVTLERSSSLGYEGPPEMLKGQGSQDGDMEWDPEARHWKARSEQHSVGRPETSGGYQKESAGHTDRSHTRRRGNRIKKEDALLRAVTFLEDALGYRDPDYNIDPGSIRSYRLRQNRAWRTCTAIAVLAYIAACFLGKPPFAAHAAGLPTPTVLQGPVGQTWGLCLECGCLLFFTCDIYLLIRYSGFRSLVTCWWQVAFFLSLFLSLVDILTRGYTHRPWSRLFRPAAFFFVGPKVRDCCLSTLHAVGALLPVLLLELLVTLAYSCVCVVLYHGVSEAPFTTLSEAFLSLFALSTTVNDPDVWMPLYHRNRANVLVFFSFLVVQVFLLHNILLASVWNEFGERMKIYSRRKKRWREESVRRAFEALDSEAAGHLSTETVMTLLMKIRPHYDGSKRYMMFERIVHSVSRSRSGKHYDASEVTKVNRRDFCDNIVEALSLKIRTMREQKIARRGQYLLLPLYVWNMAFVLVTCAMSPWVFNTRIFWAVLLPTSFLLGVSVLAEILMTGVRAYLVLPWNRVKTLSLVLTVTGLSWFFIFTATSEWEQIFQAAEWGEIRSVHIQVSIGLLMSARCLDFGTLLRLVPSIHSVVSIMYSITPSVFAQAGVIFTIFHVYAYLGMALYGGVITQDADYGDTPFANLPYYYDNNFNSYPESLVTLFEFLVMNNWNMIITGYIHASPLTMWAYVYFLSFITLAVALALNVLTAIFMTAFTATSIKANMPVVRGAGNSSRSMTSGVARTALGAGASLALRPSMGQYLSSVSEQGSGDYSPREGQSRPGNNTESMTLKVDKDDMEIKDDREPGSRGWGRKRFASYPSPSTQQRRQQQQIQPNHRRQGSPVLDFTLIPALLRSSSGGKSGGRGVSPAPAPVAPPVRYPDPLRPSRLSASAVLPEDEAVEKVREERILRRDDSYLGWGTGSGGDGGGPPAPPPPGAGAPGRRRWGSGHYYKVSRRNSYSDKDMFEGNIVGEEEEEDVAGKILGAVAIGLGNAIGIRACMLREGETRLRMHGKNAGPRQRSDTHSSGEDEPMEHLESQVMFESRTFRRMVAPHLSVQRAGLAPFDARDDEGWEAMAMREELTDMMLNSAFGEAIASEFPPAAESPGLTNSRSGFPATPVSTKNISEDVPPLELEQASRASSSGEDDIEEDYDLPKDLGIRTWSKPLTKEERAMRMGYKSKTAVLSIQCILAIRKPAAVVVYTAKVLQ